MNLLGWITRILVIVGALNWGLTAFGLNVVEAILGAGTAANVVYWLVGLAGIWEIVVLFKN